MRFVARQPIFDRSEQVIGYELLFRMGIENAFMSADGDEASRAVLDNSLLIGLDTLCDGHKAFINCTADVLLKDYVTLLPKKLTVAEILSSVEPQPQIVDVCRKLREAGYRIALDDFVLEDKRQPLVKLAHILKVDFSQTPAPACHELVQRYAPPGIQLLAAKVETRQQFESALQMGYHLFQGYFFHEPTVLSSGEIPALKVHYVRLLQAAQKPLLDYRELEALIKCEASLCYRLLRYLNSAAFFFPGGITSIHHALVLLGEQAVRKWVSLVALMASSQKRCPELLRTSMVRARFCELLAPYVRLSDTDLFLMGLLSTMDAMLDVPMPDLLSQLPVSPGVRNALLSKGETRLRSVYEMVLAYESGDWGSCNRMAGRLKLHENEVAGIYFLSLKWAREVSRGWASLHGPPSE